LPFTAQDKWDFAVDEEFCRDISPATNRITFTEGELKVIKDIMGYLDYKGMEDYHDSLENIMLKYGGDEK
jgi:hypothetical protein